MSISCNKQTLSWHVYQGHIAADCNPIMIIKRAIDLARSEKSKQTRLVQFVNPFDAINPA